MQKDDLSKKIEDKNEDELNQLEKEIIKLEEDVKELFSQLGITPETLKDSLDKNNFTKEEWEHLEKERKKINEHLLREIENVDTPSRKEKKFKELESINNSLFRI